MTKTILMAASALALLAAGPVAAMQTQTDAAEPAAAPADDAASTQSEGKPLTDGTTPQERANTARLNAEQAARAKAENVAYDQQVQAVAREDAAAQAAYAEETAAYEAEKARVAAMSAEERMKWEADVAACKAGDTSRCAPPSAPTPPNP